jgi:hypothetical protein
MEQGGLCRVSLQQGVCCWAHGALGAVCSCIADAAPQLISCCWCQRLLTVELPASMPRLMLTCCCNPVLMALVLLQRWGLPRLTRTRKENRKKDIKLFNQNIDILKAAAHMQPEVPVQLARPLPQWQVDRMRRRLESAQVRGFRLQSGVLEC